MSREVDRDFVLLRNFVRDYRLQQILENPNGVRVLKAAHKSYLPFLQLWALCSDAASNGNLVLFGEPITDAGRELKFLRETVSDVGSGMFCCLHGAYKPGHMALRSGIENFLRFATGPFNPSAMDTTSVYELFDFAKIVPSFSGCNSVFFQALRQDYVELCKFTHSASSEHMLGIHALSYFPSFDDTLFQDWLSLAKSCMIAMATVILRGMPVLYRSAHYSAKEILEELMPKSEVVLLNSYTKNSI